MKKNSKQLLFLTVFELLVCKQSHSADVISMITSIVFVLFGVLLLMGGGDYIYAGFFNILI